jgi:hypothetical protein
MNSELKTFIRSYIETALWSSSAGDAENESVGCLDAPEFSDYVFTVDSLKRIIGDCRQFMASDLYICAVVDLVDLKDKNRDEAIEQVAYDFWLTRNRHGAGFWDGDYPKELGKALTEFANSFGTVNVIPDNGKFYVE